MKKNSFITRAILLCMFLFAAGSAAWAQKDILLYETDFTDWGTTVDAGSSNKFTTVTNGSGVDFQLEGGVTVNSNGSCTNGAWSANSNRKMIFPSYNFINGGVVEFELAVGSSNRQVSLTSPTSGLAGITWNYTGDGTSGTGTQTTNLTKNTSGVLTFTIPANGSFIGDNSFIFTWQTCCITKITIYSSVGSTPYVGSTNYTNLNIDPSAGAHTMRGTADDPAYSGVATNAAVNVKGWNISGGITLSLEGADAGKFSFNDGGNAVSTLTIDNPTSTSLVGFTVPLQFSPSSQVGVGSAVLVIADATNPARNYKVALTGITDNGTTAPQLIGPVDVIPFYTSVIEPVSQTYSFAGIYLTTDAKISFTGPVAGRLKASKTSFSIIEAGKGATVTITYTGTPSASLHDETTSFMIITSGGSTLTVPLRLETFDLKPPLHALEFAADPAGTAIIKLSLAGPLYPYGSTVQVTVIPENDYYITGWSDNAGSTSDFRTIRIKPDGTTPNLITVKLAPVGSGCNNCNPAGGFTAYIPANVNDDGFRPNWSKNPNESPATVYTVTVYDKGGNAVGTCTAPAGTYSCDITGLTPADKSDDLNFMYSYKVEASDLLPADPLATPPLGAPVPETAIVGPFRLTGAVDFTCGQ